MTPGRIAANRHRRHVHHGEPRSGHERGLERVRERDVAGFGQGGRMQDVIDDWRVEIHQRTPYPRPAMQAVNICDQLSLDVACADAVF